jgi:hypothetical protein
LTREVALPGSSRRTVLRNARFLDGTRAAPRPGVDALLEGGKIATVGRSSSTATRSRTSRSSAIATGSPAS